MFIACIGVFLVLLTATLFKGRKRIIYNRDSTKEYPEILLAQKIEN